MTDRSNRTGAANGWSESEVAGHTCHVYEPPEPSPHRFTVLYLHGVHLQQLRDHEPFVHQFKRYGLRVIGPAAGPCWWSDRVTTVFDGRMSAEQYLLQEVLPYVQRRWGAGPPGIALLGNSMGGQGALRLAFKYPDTFPIVSALAPAVDIQIRWEDGDVALREMYADAEAARQDTAILHVHPLYWPRNVWFCCDPADHRWYPSAERLHMKLAALGIPHETDLETEAGGHGFAYYNRMADAAVGFIADRLQRERLRVV